MTRSPCKNCPDRTTICHTVCDKYKEFKKQTHKEYKQKCQNNEVDAYEIRRRVRFGNWRWSKR